jgi:hypothetical protein
MRIIAVLAALVLVACGSPRIEGGNEAGGIVSFGGSNQREAFAAADAHCRRYGKVARMIGVSEPVTLLFDCR